jgi:hypothetical protein
MSGTNAGVNADSQKGKEPEPTVKPLEEVPGGLGHGYLSEAHPVGTGRGGPSSVEPGLAALHGTRVGPSLSVLDL